MILVVDDEPAILEGSRAALAGAGFEVRTASGPDEALNILAAEEPELIISDVAMPGMDGFAFKAAVEASWPNRQTPFLFLSSMKEADHVVRGLEAGAWDYLSKPIPPSVLAAKVRSVVTVRSRFVVPSFKGDLFELPVGQLLEFALLKEITGELEIEGEAGARAVVPVRRGSVSAEDRQSLERAFPGGAAGRFVLRIPPPDWSQLVPRDRTPAPAAPKPIGKLSGVRLGDRLFTLQTEVAGHPRPQVVTIVVLNGRVMRKKVTPAAGDTAGMEAQIAGQHREIEEELLGKMAALAARGSAPADAASAPVAAPTAVPADPAESDDAAYERCVDSGFDLYLKGDLAGALAIWEEADRRKPGDRVLATNMQTLRVKLGQADPR